MTLMLALPASIEASGPTNPTKPKPADAGVPLTWNKATGMAETIAVIRVGSKIIGWILRCLHRFF